LNFEIAMLISFTERPFNKEYFFITSRSNGPGGQHVNKTETRVELRFHIDNSELLSDEEKQTIKYKLKNRINAEGFLQIVAQEHRSQFKNKQIAEQRFYEMLILAMRKTKKRRPTAIPRKAKENRLQTKRIVSEKKMNRGKIRGEG
jgi:ribosome-associated protein